MALEKINLKKNHLGIARMLLTCMSPASRSERLDVSGALRRWRKSVKAQGKHQAEAKRGKTCG